MPRLNDIDYIVQGMTSAMLAGGDDLAREMRAAGFRYVFLGIENVLDVGPALSPRRREERRAQGRADRSAARARRPIELLHRHGMFVVGGLIVGNPGDTRASIEANLAFARRYVDWPYIQHPTPYPGTPMTRDFRDNGLIVNDDEQQYDGTTAVVRTEHLETEEIEFLRWRAERWMKCRHLPVGLRARSAVRAAARHARCAVTPSADPRGRRGWASNPSATRSGATARSARTSASICPVRRGPPCGRGHSGVQVPA